MTRKAFSLYLTAFVFALVAFSLVPAVHAAPDGGKVTGTILTLDFGAKTVTIKKSDSSTVTLTFAKTTKISRNGKKAKNQALVLNDTVTAKYSKNLVLKALTATGPQSKKIAGALTAALKGNGTVTIGNQTVSVTAETRISRNGALVSLSQLTSHDKLVAHVKAVNGASGGYQALDLICDGPHDGLVRGLISAIQDSQITVMPDNGADDIVLNVTDSTMIEKDGKTATLADLTVGMQIKAAFDPDTNDAYVIEADSDGENNDAHIHGTVSAIDTTAGTLTIAPASGDPVTLNVDASTEIEVNHTSATLADIQVGMPVFAEYDSSTLLAMEIKAGDRDDNHQDHKIMGTVSAVDLNAQTVTITPDRGGDPVTLNVTAETDIQVDDAPGTLADIQVNDKIRAEFDPTTLNALEMNIGSGDGEHHGHQEHVSGTITNVDLTNSQVTIDPEHKDAVTVNIVDGTKIRVNGESSTLEQVQVGQHAIAEYNTDSLDATKLDVGDEHDGSENRRVEGQVTAIDAGQSTVTITPHHGDAVTVKVVDTTDLQVNGQAASLADVVVGDGAFALFDKTSFEASKLYVHSQEPQGDHVEGLVTAIDPDAKTVTIDPPNGDPATVNVVDATEIRVNGQPATLADVSVGDHAKAEYDGTTMNASRLMVNAHNGGH